MKQTIYLILSITLAVAGIFILLHYCNPKPTPPPTPSISEIHNVEDLLRQVDSLNSENQTLAAKVIHLESLPNNATQATKTRVVTKIQKQFVPVKDTTAENTLARLKESFQDSTLQLDSLRTLVAEYECNPLYSLSYNDKFLDLYVEATKDSSRFEVGHTDEIVLQYVKHKKFLKKAEYTVEAYSTSPYSTIANLQSVKLRESPKSFGLGFTFGYDILTRQPSLSTGITYTPIKF